MAAYIHDGYTVNGLIAEVPRLHPAVRFKYRPALIEEVAELSDGAPRQKEYNRRAAKLIQKHIVEWDIQDPQDGHQIIQVNVDNLMRLNISLFQRLLGIITCSQADDGGEDIDLEMETKN